MAECKGFIFQLPRAVKSLSFQTKSRYWIWWYFFRYSWQNLFWVGLGNWLVSARIPARINRDGASTSSFFSFHLTYLVCIVNILLLNRVQETKRNEISTLQDAENFIYANFIQWKFQNITDPLKNNKSVGSRRKVRSDLIFTKKI